MGRAAAWWAGVRGWAEARPGASGLLVLAVLAAVIVSAAAFIASTARTTTALGVVTALHLSESDQGSSPYAYVRTPFGAFGTGLPRGSDCRPGAHVTVVVTRDLLGTHQAVSLLSLCLVGQKP